MISLILGYAAYAPKKEDIEKRNVIPSTTPAGIKYTNSTQVRAAIRSIPISATRFLLKLSRVNSSYSLVPPVVESQPLFV